jgi:hypothetical protein
MDCHQGELKLLLLSASIRFLLGLFLDRSDVTPTRRTLSRPHGGTVHKSHIFIVSAVRTVNPTKIKK